jgi:hypothetical protein
MGYDDVISRLRSGRGSLDVDNIQSIAGRTSALGYRGESRSALEPPKLRFLERVGTLFETFEPVNAFYQAKYKKKNFFATYGKDILTNIYEAATGRRIRKERRKYTKDILIKLGAKDRKGKIDWVDVGGLMGDILFDPTTYVTGGLLKKGARIGMKDLGPKATKMIKKGINPDLVLRLARKNPDKYAKGIAFMGKEFIPRGVAKAPFKKVGGAVGQIPIGSFDKLSALRKVSQTDLNEAAIKLIDGGSSVKDVLKLARKNPTKYIRGGEFIQPRRITDAYEGVRRAFNPLYDIEKMGIKGNEMKKLLSPYYKGTRIEIDDMMTEVMDWAKKSKDIPDAGKILNKALQGKGIPTEVVTDKFLETIRKDLIGKFTTKLPANKVDDAVKTVSNIKFGAVRNQDELYEKIIRHFDDSDDVFETIKSFVRGSSDNIKNQAAWIKELKKTGDLKPGMEIFKTMDLPASTGNELLDDILHYMHAGHLASKEAEMAGGLLKGQVPSYQYRMLTKEGREFMDQGGDVYTAMSKEMRTKLGSSKKRQWFKIIDENGKEVVGNYKRMGLVTYNKEKLVAELEKATGKKIQALQVIQDRLVAGDVKKGTGEILAKIAELKEGLAKPTKISGGVLDDFAEASADDASAIINGIVNAKKSDLETYLAKLQKDIESGAFDFVDELSEGAAKAVGKKKTKATKLVELQDEIMKLSNREADEIANLMNFDAVNKAGNYFKLEQTTIEAINKEFLERYGFKLFEDDAFRAYAARNVNSIKALRTDHFLQGMKKFGKDNPQGLDFMTDVDGMKWIKSSAPQLEGKLLPESFAKYVDKASSIMSNDESMNEFLKMYDKAMFLWKGSVTGWFPAFHTRNAIGGAFNNWIAGVNNPLRYSEAEKILHKKAGFITLKNGKEMSYDAVRKLVKEYGVTGQVGYLDVAEALQKTLDPKLSQKLAKYPATAMGAIEDRLRTTLFIDRLIKGDEAFTAADKVLKFHFDYMPEGFTKFERTFTKRLIPFYTFTRHNIPLQLEQMIAKPGKYAGVFKTQRAMSDMNSEERQYLPDWLKDRIIFRTAADKFLTGFGLPVEEAFEKLGDPKRGFAMSLSPAIKYPIEMMTGYNMFKNMKIKDDTSGTRYKNAPDYIKKLLRYHEEEYRDKDTGEIKTFARVDPKRKYIFENTPGTSRFVATMLAMLSEDEKQWFIPLVTSIKDYQVDLQYSKRKQIEKTREELLDILMREGEVGKFEKYFESD